MTGKKKWDQRAGKVQSLTLSPWALLPPIWASGNAETCWESLGQHQDEHSSPGRSCLALPFPALTQLLSSPSSQIPLNQDSSERIKTIFSNN